MESELDEKVHKKKRSKRGKSKVISFDEEVVPKHAAEEILAKEKIQDLEKSIETDLKGIKLSVKKVKKRKQEKETDQSRNDFAFKFNVQTNDCLETDKHEKVVGNEKSKTKRKKGKNDESSHLTEDNGKNGMDDEVTEDTHVTEQADVSDSAKPKKKKKKPNVDESEKQEASEESNANNPEQKKEESIRERKRKKHAQLLKEKKLKTELALQEKSLNYLSKWKHTRSEWKFEKLRQIWLQQNMYDSAKVPPEFWETLLEYFSNSKGKAREIILKEALKIMEEEEKLEDTENSENNIKAERARDIIQNLQE